nr:G-protein coupled receptor 4-like [Labrus bergylta]
MADNDINITIQDYSFEDFNYFEYEYYQKDTFIKHVVTWIIISIGLPLTLIAIGALCFLVRKDHVAPVYVINLLISDLIQLCCLLIEETNLFYHHYLVTLIYFGGLVISVIFMVCLSLERYLDIAHPLWYRFKRIKISVVVSVVVWLSPVVMYLPGPVGFIFLLERNILIVSIIPFLLFIFFLFGTLRALSASVSVPFEEKRRNVVILVLVLLIYTYLLLLPLMIVLLNNHYFSTLRNLSFMFKLSPLADLILYVFLRKESICKLCTAVNWCRVVDADTNI